MILYIYFYENNKKTSILDYSGLEICLLVNEIVNITGNLINIDLLIGEEYGVLECEEDIAREIENTTHRIYPIDTEKKVWNIVEILFSRNQIG
jgi:hypothetical protein